MLNISLTISMLELLADDVFYYLIQFLTMKEIISLSMSCKQINHRLGLKPFFAQYKAVVLYKSTVSNKREHELLETDIFIHACVLGHIDLVEFLYRNNQHLHSEMNYGLRLANEHKQMGIVKFLVEQSGGEIYGRKWDQLDMNLLETYLDCGHLNFWERHHKHSWRNKSWEIPSLLCKRHLTHGLRTFFEVGRYGMIVEKVYLIFELDDDALNLHSFYQALSSITIEIGGSSIIRYSSHMLEHIDVINDTKSSTCIQNSTRSASSATQFVFSLDMQKIFGELCASQTDSQCFCHGCSNITQMPGLKLEYLYRHQVNIFITFNNFLNPFKCEVKLFAKYYDFDKPACQPSNCIVTIHQALHEWIELYQPVADCPIFYFKVSSLDSPYNSLEQLIPQIIIILKSNDIEKLVAVDITLQNQIYYGISWVVIKTAEDHSYLQLILPHMPIILLKTCLIRIRLEMLQLVNVINMPVVLINVNNIGVYRAGMFDKKISYLHIIDGIDVDVVERMALTNTMT